MLALLRGSASSRLTVTLAVLALMAVSGASLLTLQPAHDARAAPASTMRVSPVSQTVGAGTEISVDIFADDVVMLAAYEFTLTFQPSAVNYVTITNGPFLSSTGRSITCVGPIVASNNIRYGCNTIGQPPPDGPTGSGLLATVRLSASCSGASPLQLSVARMSDDLGAPFAVSAQHGSVTITGGAACPMPPSTSTPIPTATPTHTPTPTHTSEPTATSTAAATPTATPGGATTATPVSTWTPAPTWTVAPTWTPVPTWTPQSPPTNTPSVHSELLVGDANCSGAVDPVDATFILQWWAGLVAVLPCPADADGDRTLSILDATVILQYSAGLVSTLPP